MAFKFYIKYVVLVVLVSFTFSCENKNQLEKTIASINTDIKTERFDRIVAEASLSDFSKVRKAYPFMFSEKDNDSTWGVIKKDTLQIQLFEAVDKAFSDFKNEEYEIESLYNHLKYYFSNFNTPRVITSTNYVDYRNNVIVTDTIVVLALDTYLGSNHEFYQDIHQYIRRNFNKNQIVVDLAEQYAQNYIYQKKNRTLLDDMIYYGKVLYFKDVIIPFKTEAERIGYTQEELNWAKANEHFIWRYFVERELLYSTDFKLASRFINPAPFSKFYLEGIDSKSPGRIGMYIGWQIVRAYMSQNNEVTLQELLTTNAKEIFNKSKFKPSK